MWPFDKKPKASVPVPPQQISFSQVDVTDRFGENLSLGPDDWIDTVPLNTSVPDPQSQGLPPLAAAAEETYLVADRLSRLRESIPLPGDGVYCPICHKANVALSPLRTPCPKCGRALLKFGWD
jgi:hypothetical protein